MLPRLFFTSIFLVFAFTCHAPCEAAGGDIWRFNFAPASAPKVKSFIRVGGDSEYDKRKGYGWLDAAGALKRGSWEGDDAGSWEGRENLNLICRPGPDGLARSFFSGPATFALDLQPGKYEIWTLTGDSGLLEFAPHEAYRIVVGGVTVHEFAPGENEFYRRFETPDMEDDLTQLGVWRRYIDPRFKWTKAIVEVEDGRLTVNVDGKRRDRSLLDFTGDYAFTEMRGGPPERFAGALNALVVLKAGSDGSSGRKEIETIDAWRRDDFAAKWPLKSRTIAKRTRFADADHRRGYTVFSPGTMEPLSPDDRVPSDGKSIRLRATPGEYAPITFGVCPLKDLGPTRVRFEAGPQTRESGPAPLQAAVHVSYGVLRYAAAPTGVGEKSWRPSPAMIVPTDVWAIREGVTKQFWLTCRIPEETKPGVYAGKIEISPEKAEKSTIDLEIEVLPFKLLRPGHLSVGMTYFSPAQYAYFGEERFWKRMEDEFRDMRAHNMTSVQFTGIRMDDTPRMDRALSIYRAAGFENPVYLLESYGAMSRLQRQGIAWDTEKFQARYVEFIREFLAEAGLRNWPAVIINFGDEFTNAAIEEFGARVARSLKAIPGIVTGADANGYKEVTLLAPEVDILAFNNGWDGPKGVNHGKKLLNKETVELVLKAGATPWLVNVGTDRFSSGFWFWKMTRLGVRGKMEWIYRGYNGMPFNGFDAAPVGTHLVYPGPEGACVPSLEYEWMRMGLDDLAYIHTLEKRIEENRDRADRQGAIPPAEAFLSRLFAAIEIAPSRPGDPRMGARSPWPGSRVEAARNEIIDLILSLR